MSTKKVEIVVVVEIETSGAEPVFVSLTASPGLPSVPLPPDRPAPRRMCRDLAAAAAAKLAAPKG